MPIYEYSCPTCDASFEELVRGNEHPCCPHCGNAQVEKQWSVPAAPPTSGSELPVCPAATSNCGRPECGMGGCQMM